MNFIKIVSIGIYNSQISRKNVKKSDGRHTAMFELELPIDDGGISYINKEAMPIRKDVLICAKPNQIRCTQFPFKSYYVHLRVLDEYLCNELNALPNFIKIGNYDAYKSIFKDLCKYSATYIKRDEIILQSLILKLIHRLCTEVGNSEKYEKITSVNAVNEALGYINNNIENDLSLKNVAEKVNLSPTYFHTCFKYAVGKTVREYVEEIRIKNSINLMLTTDMTLAEIAYSSGFSSQSYYSSAFKRKMGCTPREYIKKLNNKYKI